MKRTFLKAWYNGSITGRGFEANNRMGVIDLFAEWLRKNPEITVLEVRISEEQQS